jgi:fumarate reductase subunit C
LYSLIGKWDNNFMNLVIHIVNFVLLHHALVNIHIYYHISTARKNVRIKTDKLEKVSKIFCLYCIYFT